MNMTRVARFHELGSADVLKHEEIPLAEPGADEVRIRVAAMSLNRADGDRSLKLNPKLFVTRRRE